MESKPTVDPEHDTPKLLRKCPSCKCTFLKNDGAGHELLSTKSEEIQTHFTDDLSQSSDEKQKLVPLRRKSSPNMTSQINACTRRDAQLTVAASTAVSTQHKVGTFKLPERSQLLEMEVMSSNHEPVTLRYLATDFRYLLNAFNSGLTVEDLLCQ